MSTCTQCHKAFHGEPQRNLFGDPICMTCAGENPTEEKPKFTFYEVQLVQESQAWACIKLPADVLPRDLTADQLREIVDEIDSLDWEPDQWSTEICDISEVTEDYAQRHSFIDATDL